MIISLFAILFVVGVLIFILGIKEESVVYQMISMILFIILMAQSLYITVPFMAATNATNYTIREKTYMEPGLSAFCLAFIFCDIVLVVIEYLAYRKRRGGPVLPSGL